MEAGVVMQSGSAGANDGRMHDLTATIENIRGILGSVSNCKSSLSSLVQKIKSTRKINDGHPILDARIHTLILHLMNLLRFHLLKINGKSLEGSKVIEMLVRTRVILDHTRGLEEKLKSQIGKLFAAASNNSAEPAAISGLDGDIIDIAMNDPFKFKPNLDDLSNRNTKADDGVEESQDQIYKVPKFFGTKLEDRESKRLTRAENYKRKFRESRIISDLAEEFFDAPEQAGTTGTGHSRADLTVNKDMKADGEKEAYELEHMIRLREGREGARRRKRLEKGAKVMSLIDEFSAIEEDFRSIRRIRYTHNATMDLDNTCDDKVVSPNKIKKAKRDNEALISNTNVNLDALSREVSNKFAKDNTVMRKRLRKLNKKEKLRAKKA